MTDRRSRTRASRRGVGRLASGWHALRRTLAGDAGVTTIEVLVITAGLVVLGAAALYFATTQAGAAIGGFPSPTYSLTP